MNKMEKHNPLIKVKHQELFNGKIWIIEAVQINCIFMTIRYLQSKGWNDSDARRIVALNQEIPILCVMQLHEEFIRNVNDSLYISKNLSKKGELIEMDLIHEKRIFKVLLRQHNLVELRRFLNYYDKSDRTSRTDEEISAAAKSLSFRDYALHPPNNEDIDHLKNVSNLHVIAVIKFKNAFLSIITIKKCFSLLAIMNYSSKLLKEKTRRDSIAPQA